MSDVDILVRPADLKQAITLLQGLGFESVDQTLSFLKKGSLPLRVDLHEQLWFFNQEKVWSEVVLKRSDEALPILSPELNLLHIILHALLQDGIISSNSINDGKRILAFYSSQWSWRKFADLVESEGWTRVVALYLNHLNQIETGIVSKAILRRWTVSKRLENQLLNSEVKHGYQRMILVQDHFLGKGVLLWKINFPSFAFLKYRYPQVPNFLLFVLPLYRVILLAYKGIKHSV